MNGLLEVNKRTIQDYAELAFNQRKPEEAVATYQGPYYRQHNSPQTICLANRTDELPVAEE